MTTMRKSSVSLIVSYIIMVVLSSVAVVLRFVSIRMLKRELKSHDLLCVLSLVSRSQIDAVLPQLTATGLSYCLRY